MRVSFVVDSEGWGGAETWVVHHVRRAAACGVEASVVASTPIADRFRTWLPADRVVAAPMGRFTDDAPAVRAALTAQSPDVVHVNLVDPGSNAAVLQAALATAPTVATLHLPGDVDGIPGRAVLADLYARLRLLITASAEAAEQVQAYLAEPTGGIVVTQNGVDIPSDPSGPAGREPPSVGVLCRLTEQKGVDVLVEARRLLVDRGRSLEVLVAGAGREEGRLRSAAADLPVHFVGWVEQPRDLLRRLDVFCLPSRREAMPLALLEALADGLPCVATDVGDVGKVLGSVVALVPPGDSEGLAGALKTLLADRALRVELGRAGRSFAERHLDADAMAARTFDLLRRCAATPAT